VTDEEYYAEIEKAGHRLIRNGDGKVDFFAMEFEYHNGPMCELCDDSWCEHCRDSISPCQVGVIEGEVVILLESDQ